MRNRKQESRRGKLWKRCLSLALAGCVAVTGGFMAPPAEAQAAEADASTVTWVMSQEGKYWQEQEPLATAAWDANSHSDLYIDVNENITYQKMAEDIWGGCFNERGWKRLLMLTEEERSHILDLLFKPDEPEGLHLTLGRIPIGASDFANTLYTLDDLPEGVATDYNMEYFSIERDKSETGIIPFIKEALKRNPNMKFWASPWSPPAWMKDNNNLIAGNIVYTEENMAAYAQYFKKFVESYKAEGINISMVSPQNEPTMWTAYTSCIWTGQQLCDFIRDHLGPAMSEIGVEVYLGTFTNSNDRMMDAALKDPESRKYISGVTFQWWSYFKSYSLYHTGFDLGMMQSETMCGNGNNDWRYAENQFDIMWMYLSTGISAYNLWNMVLEWDGVNPGGHNTAANPWPQNAPITVNDNTKEYRINPHYYEYKHFTNFIQPGARRISSTGTYDAEFPLIDERESDDRYAKELHEIAFRNPDGSNVLMVKNGSSSTKHVDINFNGRKVSVDLPAHSIHSFQAAGTPLAGNEPDMRNELPEYMPAEQIITLENKGTGNIIGVDSGSVKDGAKIIQWDYTKEANQEWYLSPVEGQENTYKLMNTKSGKIAAVEGGNTNDGAKLLLWHYEGTSHTEQHWVLETDEATGYSRLKNVKSGHYLSVSGNRGAQAEQKADNASSDSQWWKVTYMNASSSANKTALASAIREAAGKVKAEYTAESWATLETALNTARAVNAKASATQAEVDAAASALDTAIQNLAKAPTADKTALQAAINGASEKNREDYTPESWAKLESALNTAKEVNSKTSATQAEADAAASALNTAIQGLVKAEAPAAADKTALASAIQEASLKAEKDYTAETWKNFAAALNSAKEINGKSSATQAEVDAAVASLLEASQKLAPVPAPVKAPSSVKAAWKGAKSIQVSWKKSSNAKKYEVYRSYSRQAGYKRIKTVTGTSYTDKGASAGKTAYYKVVAVDGNRKSADSKTVSAYIVKAPAGLKASAKKKTVTVSFKKSDKASGYVIYRASKKNGKYAKVATLKSGKSVKKAFKKMKKGTYYYKVRAYRTVDKKNVYSSYSAVKPVKVK